MSDEHPTPERTLKNARRRHPEVEGPVPDEEPTPAGAAVPRNPAPTSGSLSDPVFVDIYSANPQTPAAEREMFRDWALRDDGGLGGRTRINIADPLSNVLGTLRDVCGWDPETRTARRVIQEIRWIGHGRPGGIDTTGAPLSWDSVRQLNGLGDLVADSSAHIFIGCHVGRGREGEAFVRRYLHNLGPERMATATAFADYGTAWGYGALSTMPASNRIVRAMLRDGAVRCWEEEADPGLIMSGSQTLGYDLSLDGGRTLEERQADLRRTFQAYRDLLDELSPWFERAGAGGGTVIEDIRAVRGAVENAARDFSERLQTARGEASADLATAAAECGILRAIRDQEEHLTRIHSAILATGSQPACMPRLEQIVSTFRETPDTSPPNPSQLGRWGRFCQGARDFGRSLQIGLFTRTPLEFTYYEREEEDRLLLLTEPEPEPAPAPPPRAPRLDPQHPIWRGFGFDPADRTGPLSLLAPGAIVPSADARLERMLGDRSLDGTAMVRFEVLRDGGASPGELGSRIERQARNAEVRLNSGLPDWAREPRPSGAWRSFGSVTIGTAPDRPPSAYAGLARTVLAATARADAILQEDPVFQGSDAVIDRLCVQVPADLPPDPQAAAAVLAALIVNLAREAVLRSGR